MRGSRVKRSHIGLHECKYECKHLSPLAEGSSSPLTYLRDCLHGDGGPQVAEVARSGGVTCLSI